MIIVTSSFSKCSVFKKIAVHRKLALSNSSGLKNVFEEKSFRTFLDGLVWTVGLTLEKKLSVA